ncbi:MAG: DUF4249 domain-containing protein [Ginsengibacter sp.]
MKKAIVYIISFCILWGCKEKFNAKIISPPTGYLVVEGFISSGANATKISLTRTVKLYDVVNTVYEHGAVINIESETNELFPLNETADSVYTSGNLALDNTKKYRLHIITRDSKVYVSDFATFKTTPVIDSVSWARENGGVKIYVNTHDLLNSTKYYKWDYEETWEFHSPYYNSLVYQYDATGIPIAVGFKFPDHSIDTTIHKCWNTVGSTNINIGSSEKLSQNIIQSPLTYIEPSSVKLSVLYSINVHQYSVSHEAYIFFQNIKKNTENLGSIFDAQPTELQGNIHCVSDPSEIVIGYIDISEETTKRIFISNDEVPGWGYGTKCAVVIVDNQRDSILRNGVGLWPTIPFSLFPLGGVKQFYATGERSCVDCTVNGSSQRPIFWP